jgi:hypothetical protein
MQVVSYPGNMTPEGRSDGGTARVNQCVIAGPVSLLEGGTWSGGENVFDSATRAPEGDNGSKNDSVRETVLTAMLPGRS